MIASIAAGEAYAALLVIVAITVAVGLSSTGAVERMADLFLPGADDARTSAELSRVFAHRRGFWSGLMVGLTTGLILAIVWPW